MFDKIKDIYYSVKNGIRNIVKWIPIIWDDHDWDDYYIYNLLYQKFNYMEKFFRSDKVWSAKALDVADKLKVAKLLCKRIVDENYLTNALMPIEQKYGECKWHFEPSSHKGLSKMVFDESEDERKARSRAYKHSDYMEKQDIDYLFKFLNKYIREFWD